MLLYKLQVKWLKYGAQNSDQTEDSNKHLQESNKQWIKFEMSSQVIKSIKYEYYLFIIYWSTNCFLVC